MDKNHIYLELLDNRRVQELIKIVIKHTGCKADGNIIENIKQTLRGENGSNEKWKQLEIKL